MLVKAIPVGRCQCKPGCQATAYERHYLGKRGEKVVTNTLAMGHKPNKSRGWDSRAKSGKWVPCQPIYQLAMSVHEELQLSLTHLGKLCGVGARGFYDLKERKWIEAEKAQKAERGLRRLQALATSKETRPRPDFVLSKPLYRLLRRKCAAAGISLKTASSALGYSAHHSLSELALQKWVGIEKAMHILDYLMQISGAEPVKASPQHALLAKNINKANSEIDRMHEKVLAELSA